MERNRSWTQRLRKWAAAFGLQQQRGLVSMLPLQMVEENVPKDRRGKSVVRRLREAGGL